MTYTGTFADCLLDIVSRQPQVTHQALKVLPDPAGIDQEAGTDDDKGVNLANTDLAEMSNRRNRVLIHASM